MAKSRRVSRKSEMRKSRKAERKSRKAQRKNRKTSGGRGLFSTIYSPVGHLLAASGETVGTVTNTTRNVVKRGLSGLNRVGRSVTGHANAAVRNLVSRKRRAERK